MLSPRTARQSPLDNSLMIKLSVCGAKRKRTRFPLISPVNGEKAALSPTEASTFALERSAAHKQASAPQERAKMSIEIDNVRTQKLLQFAKI
ncbi:Uncharacterised protein [Chlamydia trachomatis]|nr:Uncharacterised protein [Chlamydia trachomatis]